MSAGPIMILAGGTGGHVFPGLAVARVLRERAESVVWMGTRNGLEARLVPEAGIEMEWISVAGIRGRGPLAWITAPFRLLLGSFSRLRHCIVADPLQCLASAASFRARVDSPRG